MKTTKPRTLSLPTRYAFRFSAIYGVDWKHEDEDLGTYTRTFASVWELGEWLRDRYGARFSERVKSVEFSSVWQGKL